MLDEDILYLIIKAPPIGYYSHLLMVLQHNLEASSPHAIGNLPGSCPLVED
jgi:hypothetical protein